MKFPNQHVVLSKTLIQKAIWNHLCVNIALSIVFCCSTNHVDCLCSCVLDQHSIMGGYHLKVLVIYWFPWFIYARYYLSVKNKNIPFLKKNNLLFWTKFCSPTTEFEGIVGSGLVCQSVCFLAATKQLYKWYFPSVRPSVCPSVRPSHLFDYVPIIVSSWNFQDLLPVTEVTSMQKVKVRGQGSRSQRSQPNFTVSGL